MEVCIHAIIKIAIQARIGTEQQQNYFFLPLFTAPSANISSKSMSIAEYLNQQNIDQQTHEFKQAFAIQSTGFTVECSKRYKQQAIKNAQEKLNCIPLSYINTKFRVSFYVNITHLTFLTQL